MMPYLKDTPKRQLISITPEYKNLGYANGWNGTPDEIVQCTEKKHIRLVESDNYRCVTLYCCPECKIYWKIDSSD
jgi:hypothetical protein